MLSGHTEGSLVLYFLRKLHSAVSQGVMRDQQVSRHPGTDRDGCREAGSPLNLSESKDVRPAQAS